MSNASSPALPAVPPPPPGTNYLAAIKPSLTFVLIGTTFSSFLVPMLVALFFFAQPKTRRLPIFVMNVITVVLGIALGAWNDYMEVHAILSPLEPLAQQVFISFVSFYILVPFIVETILMMRLLVFYPPKTTPRRTLCLVFAFPVAIKTLRIIVLSLFIHQWASGTKNVGNPIIAGTLAWSSTPYVKIEWVSQLFDNSYSSIMFLWHLRKHRLSQAASTGQNARSFGSRLRTLFWIALSNFVFPIIFNIAQLVILFQDPNFFLGTYVLMVNTYVSIIGVVFATVWAGSYRKKAEEQQSSPQSSRNFKESSQPWRLRPHNQFSISTSSTETDPRVQFMGKDERPNEVPLQIFVEHSHNAAEIEA